MVHLLPKLGRLLAALIFGFSASLDAAHSQTALDDGFDPKTLDKIAESVRQVPLTEDMVNRLIASFPDMRATSAKFDVTELTEQPTADGASSDLDAMPADKRKALEAVATKYGFKDLDEWIGVASSVAMSYAYAMQGKKPGSLEEAVKKNIAQAERDPRMSEEQKQKTIAQYREIGSRLARIEPLKQNFDLVVKMSDKVTPILEAR